MGLAVFVTLVSPILVTEVSPPKRDAHSSELVRDTFFQWRKFTRVVLDWLITWRIVDWVFSQSIRVDFVS